MLTGSVLEAHIDGSVGHSGQWIAGPVARLVVMINVALFAVLSSADIFALTASQAGAQLAMFVAAIVAVVTVHARMW